MRGQVGVEAKKPRNFKLVGVVGCIAIVLAQLVFVWANTRAWLCTTVLAWVLLVLSGGSLTASVVAAIKHSWWWIIAVLASILLILQWGGTYEGC